MGHDQSTYSHIPLKEKIEFLKAVKSPVVDTLPLDTSALPGVHIHSVETEFAKIYSEHKGKEPILHPGLTAKHEEKMEEASAPEAEESEVEDEAQDESPVE